MGSKITNFKQLSFHKKYHIILVFIYTYVCRKDSSELVNDGEEIINSGPLRYMSDEDACVGVVVCSASGTD
jgi:hypothetical protein